MLALLPAVLTALATAAGWAVSRRVVGHERWGVFTSVVLPSLLLGLLAYATHTPDATTGRSLEGAAIATGVSLFSLTLYYVLGRSVRRSLVVFVFWLASLVPLYYVSLYVAIAIASLTQCAPVASDCPLG